MKLKIDFSAVIVDMKGRVLNERFEVWEEDSLFDWGAHTVDSLAKELSVSKMDALNMLRNNRSGGDRLSLGYVCATALNAGSREEKDFKKACARAELIDRIYGKDGARGAQEVERVDRFSHAVQ